MEDVKFTRSHSNSPLPEAGSDPNDPLRPEIDEENSTPNPPIAAPYQDMEVTEPDEKERLPDKEDVEEAGLSDNESELSDLDEAQFGDIDLENIAVEERPAGIIDDTNLNLIGVHKRKRAEGEGEAPKKKKKRADKPRRKKNRDEDAGDDGEAGTRRSRRSKKAGRVRAATPDEELENLTPQERRKRALDEALDQVNKQPSRRKKQSGDATENGEAEVEDMRRRMASAAEKDNNDRQAGEPARHKLKLLPEVVALLNKNNLRESICDPDINLLEAVRFFLEPLSDGSLPAYDIQKELIAALGKLPITKESLVASGIGKVILFYMKSKRPEKHIKLQAERLFTDWTRPILRRTDDFRKKEFAEKAFDPSKLKEARPAKPVNAAAAARAKALETPRHFQRARMESGPLTYSIAPKTNLIISNESGKRSGGNPDILKQIRARQGRAGGR